MTKFLNFFTSFDDFGEPVSLNYAGDSSFKTKIGAFFSILIKVFILVHAGDQLLSLIRY